MRLTRAEKAAAREAARADRKTIIERYRAGESVPRIAADYGVTQGWLTERFNDWGVPRRQNQAAHATRAGGRIYPGRVAPRTSEEVRKARERFDRARKDVIKRYRDGESVASLARAFQIDRRWVAYRLDDWGVPRRSQSEAVSTRRPGARPL